MLVKELAEIHDKPLGKINEAINDNIKKFKDSIDLIGTDFVNHLMDSNIYTQKAINASKNIYLFSERGYPKLLKILDDDVVK